MSNQNGKEFPTAKEFILSKTLQAMNGERSVIVEDLSGNKVITLEGAQELINEYCDLNRRALERYGFAVREMREAQKEYFARAGAPESIKGPYRQKAIARERTVDLITAHIPPPTDMPTQKDLFDSN